MKLKHVIGLMICLSILVVGSVSAYVYADLSVVNVSSSVTPLGDYISSTDDSSAAYYMAYSSVLYYDCTDSASGDYVSYTANNAGGSGGLDANGDYRLVYPVPICTTDFYSVVEDLGASNYRPVLSWEYGAPPPTTSCSFTATPSTGASPLSVNFSDTSSAPGNYTSWQWLVVDNETGTVASTSTLKSWTGTLNGDNRIFDVYFHAANATGTCSKFSPESIRTTLSQSQNETQKLIMEPTDAISNALISGSRLSVLDISKNIWTNITAIWGTQEFYFQYGANLYIESTADGYLKSTKNWTVLPYSSYILKIPMFPSGTISATNVSLNVVVLEGTTSGVFANAQVRLSDGQVKSTTGAGVATFNVTSGKSYQIIASYPGYNSATRTLTTGTGGTSQDTYLTLNRIVVTTATTLPPGVTAVTTLDTRTNAQKDQEMMDLIRTFAPNLILLAIVMTMMYMLGYKP